MGIVARDTKMTNKAIVPSPGVSRRRLLTVAIAGVACSAAAISGHAQAAKLDKKTAAYQESPHNGEQCSSCAYFRPPGACTQVEGTISPNGWCKLYQAHE